MTNSGDSMNRLDEENIVVIKKKFLSNKSAFAKSVNLLRDILEECKIEITHSHHRYYELLANSAAVISNRKVKTVATALSIVDGRYFVEFKSDKIIAVSRSVEKMLLEKFKVNQNKIKIITNFTDSEEIENYGYIKSYDYLRNKKNINILCIGRFHKDKDQITLLESASILNNPCLKIVLAGEGPEYDTLKEFRKKKNLDIEFAKPAKDVSHLYKKADICVLPSVRDPFPGFMLQSGLFGKPFIGADTDGISELIDHRKNGLLFPKRNVRALAEAINTFINEDDLRNNCCKELHEEVTKNYTEKNILPKIESLYSGILKN